MTDRAYEDRRDVKLYTREEPPISASAVIALLEDYLKVLPEKQLRFSRFARLVNAIERLAATAHAGVESQARLSGSAQ